MKKTNLFVSCTLLLFVILCLVASTWQRSLSFSIEDVAKDRKALDTAFTLQLLSRHDSVKLSYDGKKLTHQVQSKKSIFYPSESMTSYVKAKDMKILSDWHVQKEDEEKPSSLPSYVRGVSKAQLAIHLYYQDEKQKSHYAGLARTDLYMETKGDIHVEQYGYLDGETKQITEDSMFRIMKGKEQLGDELTDVVKDGKHLYFVPLVDASVKGERYLYRSDINPTSIQNEEQGIAVTRLAKLPSDRTYSRITMMQHQLYVLSHKKHTLYLTVYDTKGHKIKEATTPSFGRIFALYQNDSYLCLYGESTIQVWDINSMTPVMRSDIANIKGMNTDYIPEQPSDVYYQNGKLYLSMININQNGVGILVLQNNRLLYEGLIQPFTYKHQKGILENPWEADTTAPVFVR